MATETTNVAAHVFRWLRALDEAIGIEQRLKEARLASSKLEREALKELVKVEKGEAKAAASLQLQALSSPAALTDLDARTAIRITGLTFDKLEFFLAAKDLSEGSKMSENAAQISLNRLVKTGWLVKLPPSERDERMAGRPANRYRIPDVFTIQGLENKSPTTDGKTNGDESRVSPSTDGRLLPSTDGTNRKTDRRGQTPQGSVPNSHHVSDDQKDNDQISAPGDTDARERASSPETETSPSAFEPWFNDDPQSDGQATAAAPDDDGYVKGHEFSWNCVANAVVAKCDLDDHRHMVGALFRLDGVSPEFRRKLVSELKLSLLSHPSARIGFFHYYRYLLRILEKVDQTEAHRAADRLREAVDNFSPKARPYYGKPRDELREEDRAQG